MAQLTLEQLGRALDHLSRGAWQEAHAIVQHDEQWTLSCWAHGLVHVLEGDLDNARYWYNRAQRPFTVPVDVEAELAALRGSMRPEASS